MSQFRSQSSRVRAQFAARMARIVAALLVVATLSSWLQVARASAAAASTPDPFYEPVSVYVDAVNGTDSNACMRTAPCKTLQLAMIFVGSHYGSTVYLAPG